MALVITALRRDAARMPRVGLALNALAPATELLVRMEEAITLTVLGTEGRTKPCDCQWVCVLVSQGQQRGWGRNAQRSAHAAPTLVLTLGCAAPAREA